MESEDPDKFSVGPIFAGAFLIGTTVWSLANGNDRFAVVSVVCLVVLTLGAALINQKY